MDSTDVDKFTELVKKRDRLNLEKKKLEEALKMVSKTKLEIQQTEADILAKLKSVSDGLRETYVELQRCCKEFISKELVPEGKSDVTVTEDGDLVEDKPPVEDVPVPDSSEFAKLTNPKVVKPEVVEEIRKRSSVEAEIKGVRVMTTLDDWKKLEADMKKDGWKRVFPAQLFEEDYIRLATMNETGEIGVVDGTVIAVDQAEGELIIETDEGPTAVDLERTKIYRREEQEAPVQPKAESKEEQNGQSGQANG